MLLSVDVMSQLISVLSRLNWGSVPDYLAVIVAAWGLKIANDHFNKQPKINLELCYGAQQEEGHIKVYSFWVVNHSNVNVTVRWLGIRKAGKGDFTHTIGEDDTEWHLLQPGETTKPITVTVTRITQVLRKIMGPGDTRYIDAAFLSTYGDIVKKKIKVTTTMAEDNSGLPTAPYDGETKYPHPSEAHSQPDVGSSGTHGTK